MDESFSEFANDYFRHLDQLLPQFENKLKELENQIEELQLQIESSETTILSEFRSELDNELYDKVDSNEFEERLEKLEDLKFKKTRRLTHKEQYVLLNELGILEFLNDKLNLPKTKLARLIALLIDKTVQRNYLTYINHFDTNVNDCYNEASLKKVSSIFEEFGISETKNGDLGSHWLNMESSDKL